MKLLITGLMILIAGYFTFLVISAIVYTITSREQ